ncbi:MAG: dihydroorotase [Clostridia bacterium]|nr:dihydroorotase [Clostridia bacterium]
MRRITDCRALIGGTFLDCDLILKDGRIDQIVPATRQKSHSVSYVFPGFIDVHVHFREPGFSYKETIRTGSMAAARGGYTTVCAMPNLDPVPDSAEHLEEELSIIRRDAVIRVVPYGAITVGEKGETLSDMQSMAGDVAGFSDDGRGVQSEEIMKKAMEEAKRLGSLIAAHCEENDLLEGGYIHKGDYAREHAHRGISSRSEWQPIARDIELNREIGCRYHVCHVSTKESVDVIRKGKKEGVDVTCETGPHYLLLDDCMIREDGRFKMNPPIRAKEDREALIAGLLDGTVDMIATDHAPHSREEKSRGLEKSLMGIVGIETAFPLLYTYLVKEGVLTLEQLVGLMTERPAGRFGFESGIREGAPADLCIWDLDACYSIDPADFLSKGTSTPFEGWRVYGKCKETILAGETVYQEEKQA